MSASPRAPACNAATTAAVAPAANVNRARFVMADCVSANRNVKEKNAAMMAAALPAAVVQSPLCATVAHAVVCHNVKEKSVVPMAAEAIAANVGASSNVPRWAIAFVFRTVPGLSVATTGAGGNAEPVQQIAYVSLESVYVYRTAMEKVAATTAAETPADHATRWKPVSGAIVNSATWASVPVALTAPANPVATTGAVDSVAVAILARPAPKGNVHVYPIVQANNVVLTGVAAFAGVVDREKRARPMGNVCAHPNVKAKCVVPMVAAVSAVFARRDNGAE